MGISKFLEFSVCPTFPQERYTDFFISKSTRIHNEQPLKVSSRLVQPTRIKRH